ncbi:MAG: YybS family protein [Desulfobacterales bacterium]|nr:YybS family protein [Desulfobacterales bacterium]
MTLQTAPDSLAKDVAGGIAITSIISAVSIFMPLMSFFCAMLLPLPVIFYRLKLGRSVGIIVPMGAVFLMVLMMGGISANILFFVELLLLGFVLSELLEMNLTLERTFLYACGAVFLSGFVFLLFYSAISNIGIMELLSSYAAENIRMSLALYKSMGIPEESISALQDPEILEKIQYFLVRILPGLAAIFTLFIVWVSLLLARPVLKARALFFPDFGELNRWKAPDYLVWFAIGSGALLFSPMDGPLVIGLNGALVLMMVYFFQGIAIVSFFFEKKRIPRAFRVAAYTLIPLQQPLVLLIIGLGFFDMWINFRKLETEKIE